MNESEDFLHTSRNYSPVRVSCWVFKSFHSVSLSCSCLTVGKNGRIVTFKNWEDSRFGCIFIYKFLGWHLIIDVIKRIVLPDTEMRVLFNILLPFVFTYLSSQIFHDSTWLIVILNLNNTSKLTPIYSFSRKRRPHSDNHLKVFITRGVVVVGLLSLKRWKTIWLERISHIRILGNRTL